MRHNELSFSGGQRARRRHEQHALGHLNRPGAGRFSGPLNAIAATNRLALSRVIGADRDGSHARVDGLVSSGRAVCGRAHSFRFGDGATVCRRMS
jgi:hypothetical protein